MRMMLWLTTDLPEPDSPTSATVDAGRMKRGCKGVQGGHAEAEPDTEVERNQPAARGKPAQRIGSRAGGDTYARERDHQRKLRSDSSSYHFGS
jgi:hypothetical protein